MPCRLRVRLPATARPPAVVVAFFVAVPEPVAVVQVPGVPAAVAPFPAARRPVVAVPHRLEPPEARRLETGLVAVTTPEVERRPQRDAAVLTVAPFGVGAVAALRVAVRAVLVGAAAVDLDTEPEAAVAAVVAELVAA